MMKSEQIKGKIRNIAKDTGVNPNSLLQMCLFEGILEKLSKSKYKNNFILKGGLLISSLIGVNLRSTMDMDTTIKGLPVSEDTITKILGEILKIPIDKEIEYELLNIDSIRKNDIYENFTAKVICKFGKIRANLSIDITTGDAITPKEINYRYPRMLEEGFIEVITYNIETIIAEKFETISSRNILNTRARDFYDLYMLFSVYGEEIDYLVLKNAIVETSQKRGTYKTILEWEKIAEMLTDNNNLDKLWNNYKNSNTYAEDIIFIDTVKVYSKIGEIL